MADRKITGLVELSSQPAAGDLFPLVDVSDTTMSSDGSTKRITTSNLFSNVRKISITVADTENAVGLTVTQNDTTNNPNGITTTNAGTGNAIKIDQNGDTGNAASSSGAFLLDNTGNPGIGLNVYTNIGAGQASGGLVFIKADNALYDSAVVRIDNDGLEENLLLNSNNASATKPVLHITSAGTAGAVADIKITAPGPDIEFVDSDESGRAGKFEIATQSNKFQINSRNAGDNSFETIISIAQLADGGLATFNGNIKLGVDGTISTLTLAEKASIALDPAGGADGDYSGITFTATAGETVAFGDVVYLKAADSEWYLVDADAVATSAVAVAICVSSGTNGNPVTLMQSGIIRADAGFPALTIGAAVYISTTGTTTNTVTVTAPSGADDVIRIIGFALTANEIMFSPSPDHITATG